MQDVSLCFVLSLTSAPSSPRLYKGGSELSKTTSCLPAALAPWGPGGAGQFSTGRNQPQQPASQRGCSTTSPSESPAAPPHPPHPRPWSASIPNKGPKPTRDLPGRDFPAPAADRWVCSQAAGLAGRRGVRAIFPFSSECKERRQSRISENKTRVLPGERRRVGRRRRVASRAAPAKFALG